MLFYTFLITFFTTIESDDSFPQCVMRDAKRVCEKRLKNIFLGHLAVISPAFAVI